MYQKSDLEYFNRRMSSMKLERSSFEAHWRELSEKVQPRKGRFIAQDRNKGDKRYSKIINSRGTRALRIARAGLHAGIMSPTRPWFELGSPDPDMKEFAPAKVWLAKTAEILNAIFRDSNLYSMAPTMLGENLLFGTGCMIHVDDFENVARFYTQTVGSYMLAQDDRLAVDTIGREYEMTVRAMAKKFGEENLSVGARNILGTNKDAWRPVCHLIEPNPDYKPSSPLAKHFRWRSIYYEPGNTEGDATKRLSTGGYREFPGYCPRWEVTGEDIYGTDCPGMTALGDINQLQIEERRKAQAIDKHVNPPLKGPPEVKNNAVSALPGGLTVYSGDDRVNGLRPLYEVKPDLAGLLGDIQAVEGRIDDCFFVHLFKPISDMEGIQPRNMYDLTQRNQEALVELGPTLERFHGEFLSPLIDRAFTQALRAGILPEPPQELQGSPLKITYISALAIAMRATAASGIDRLSGYVGGLVQGGLNDGMKFDSDQAIDEMGAILGVPPRLILSDEVVQQRRAEIEQRKQLERMAMMAESASKTTKALADSKTGDPSALTALAGAAARR